MLQEKEAFSCRDEIQVYGMIKASAPSQTKHGTLKFYFKCSHREDAKCMARKSIETECCSWEPAALKEACAKAKLLAVGSEHFDVVRDVVRTCHTPHTCAQHNPAQGSSFDSAEELSHYVLQQVLLNKQLLPSSGLYQKLNIEETIAFCEQNFKYNAASSKVLPLFPLVSTQ